MAHKVLGIVGSYRKGGIVDQLVDQVLAGAAEKGVLVEKIYLTDLNVEFCTNCRVCMQKDGEEPDVCIFTDDMAKIVEKCQEADAYVIGSPINCYNVTAITRRFMERLSVYAYWPWGQWSPTMRIKTRKKKGVTVTSTAMPAIMGRIFTGGPRALRLICETFGAKVIASLFAGMIAQKEDEKPSEKLMTKAKQAGYRLAEM